METLTLPPPVLYNVFAMKRIVLRMMLILLLLALAAGGYLLHREQQRLEGLVAQADGLLSEQRYGEAIPAYGALLQKTPVSFLGLGRTYVEQGAEGVLACVDALLETADGARYLQEDGTVSAILALATHPAVPASFRTGLEARAARGTALLEAEAERLRQEAEAQAAAEEEARRRQDLLEQALRAREEGQLEEALALVKESGLQPELIGEIEEQLQQAQDEALAAQARTALDGLHYSEALSLAGQMKDITAREALLTELNESWARKAKELEKAYQSKLWAGAWYTLVLGEVPHLSGDRRYEGLAMGLGSDDAVIGGVFGWMRLSGGKVELVGDTLGAEKTVTGITDARDGAMGWNHGLILHADGTVTNLGSWTYGRAAVADWTGIAQVAAGAFHSLGLTETGTVLAAGLDLDGQCQVASWADVVSVAAGLRHSVALTKDGHVLAVGDNSFGQCDVSGWENVVSIRCGGNFTLGLTADGHLLAAGDNSCGQCDVFDWENVVAFDGGLWHTVALLQDGHVVSTGANGHDQCALHGTPLFETGIGAAPAGTFVQEETEFVYVGDQLNGPWLYYGSDGAVVVSFDEDTGRLKATRADLFCTYGNPPVGILAGGGDKPKDRVHATKLAWQNRAVFALTGDYYTMHKNAKGILIRRGQVIREKTKTMGCAFFPDGSLGLVDPSVVTAEELLAQGIQDAWVFGPVLIANGELQDFRRHSLARNGEVTMRTVLATYCTYHHLAACYGFTSLRQAADDLVSCGCEMAYNLDGGRSSMMVFMGEIVNKTAFTKEGWRGLRDMVGFLTSEQVPKP